MNAEACRGRIQWLVDRPFYLERMNVDTAADGGNDYSKVKIRLATKKCFSAWLP